MSQLARMVLGLFFVNAVCIVLVIATHYSDTAWGCVRYETSPRSALFDVKNNVYFVEATSIPTFPVYASSWLSNSDQLLYQTQDAQGNSQLTSISQSRFLGYVDLKNVYEQYVRLNGVSPRQKYIVFSTRDITLELKTITIHDLTTLAQIVSTTVRSTEPIALPRQTLDYVDRGWSPNEQWYGFISQYQTSTALTLVDVLNKNFQTIPLGHRDDPFIIWSPTETALAIVNTGSAPQLDVIVFLDGRWQQVYSTNLSLQDGENIYQKSRNVLDVRWTFDGMALLVTLRDISTREDAPRHMLKVFHLVNQRLARISTLLRNIVAEPKIMLGGMWVCVSSSDVPQIDDIYASGTGKLIPLKASTQTAVELATNCQTVIRAATQTTLLAKQKIAGQPEGEWIFITSDPPSSALLSLSPKLSFLHWSDDKRSVFFFDRMTMTHAVMDTTTWQPTIMPQPAYVSRGSFSPDSTRFVVLADDLHNMWLHDAQGNFLAALPLPSFERFDFTLLWSPDNQKLLLTDFTYDGRIMIADRNGQPLAIFKRLEVPYRYPTFTDPNLGWTHCEPSPKFPRLNLPQ